MLRGGRPSVITALVGRGGFPSFSALVGRVVGWRSSGCAVRARNGQLRYKRFRRLSGSWAVTISLAPDGRLYALYLRSVGLSSGCWYLIPHTTNKDCLEAQSV